MKTRVVHIITKLELGGAQEFALYIVENLDRAKFEPVLITGERGLLSSAAKAIPGLKFIELPEMVREVRPIKDLTAFFKLRRILKGIKAESGAPVIVQTHSSKAGILGRSAAWAAGVDRVIHTIHGFGFNDEQGRLTRSIYVGLERLIARVTDKFVAVAYDNIRKGVRERIFSEDRAVVIRAGIDTRFFGVVESDPKEVRAEIGIPETAPVAAMVSCLKPQKAPLDFVRVAAEVIKSVPDAHFVQAGDGELRDAMLGEAARLKITDRLHILGWRRDVREIMQASDVIVLTSLWEGLPKVLPQAMAAGKPVVATAVDGSPEAVTDGISGFLAKPHDIDKMADRVALLLSDRELAVKMGEAGRARAAEFDERQMLHNIEQLYDSILEEPV
ncbi:MAG TPA: glycosyltransferase family 4 protein [Nitrospirota bacterium]